MNSMKYNENKYYIVVEFYGEIDSSNAPQYRRELNMVLEENTKDVVFDFKHLTFMDSSGIGLVLGRYNQLKFDHRTLMIVGLNPVAYRLFELTGLFQIMPYYQSIEDIKEELV